MKEDKKKFIEILITVGGILGTFLSIFPPVFTGTIMLFSLFIVFSLLYYIFISEGFFDKKIAFLKFYKFFISIVISVSFSGIFAILLLRGMSNIDMITLSLAIIIYIFLSLILLIFLGSYEKKFRIYTDKVINIFKMKRQTKNRTKSKIVEIDRKTERLILFSAFVGAIVSNVINIMVQSILTKNIPYIIVSFIVSITMFIVLYIFTLKNFGIEVEK